MNHSKLYYGAGYYDESMPRSGVETDLPLMQQAGMNLIRIGGGAWPCWEPEESAFDFTSLHRVLSSAQAKGLEVLVVSPVDVLPEWLAQKCLAEETADSSLRPFIDRILWQLVEQCNAYSCVVGYQLGSSGDREELASHAALIRKYARANPWITCDLSLMDGDDAGTNGELVDSAGCSVFHSVGLKDSGVELALAGDFTRSLRKDNYIVLETQSQGDLGQLPHPGQIRLSAFHHFASGAAGVLYEDWHSAPDCDSKGVLSHDCQPGRVYWETAAVGADIRRLSDRLSGLKKQNRVAIVFSQRSAELLPMDADSGVDYMDYFHWIYDGFYKRNIEVDIIPDTQRDFTGYELLVVPCLYSAEDNLIWAIRDYVAGGGHLLATFRSFFADEQGLVRREPQPYGMTDVFGMAYDEYTIPEGISLPEFSWSVTEWMELLRPLGCQSVAKYAGPAWGGITGVTCHRFGKGGAAYIGCYTPDGLDAILLRLLKNWHILVPEISWPVVMKRGMNAAGKPITYLLHYNDRTTVVPCPASGEELLTGTHLEEGAPLELRPWDVKILEGNV